MIQGTPTRERLLRAAALLFRSQGYAATGVNQVLAEGGAPKGVLYFHFPGGKEQLAAEAVALTGSQLREAISGMLAAAPGPGTGIGQIAEMFGQALLASDFREGCPVATVALDASAGSEAIRASCQGAYSSWADVLERHFRDHGVAGEEARQLATFVLASFEGALLLARVQRDLTPLHTVSAALTGIADKAVRSGTPGVPDPGKMTAAPIKTQQNPRERQRDDPASGRNEQGDRPPALRRVQDR